MNAYSLILYNLCDLDFFPLLHILRILETLTILNFGKHFKSTKWVCEAHLPKAYEPCAMSSQTYGNALMAPG